MLEAIQNGQQFGRVRDEQVVRELLKFAEVQLEEVVFGFEGVCNLEDEQARAVGSVAILDDLSQKGGVRK